MVRADYLHFCSVLVEIAHLPRKLNPTTWRRYVTLENGRAIVEGLLCGRPLLFVTGHFGNWELGGYVLGLLGFPTYAIARTLDNPYLRASAAPLPRADRPADPVQGRRFRADSGRAGVGGVIATLGDQDAGQRGLFVDFFGRPASTHKAVALLALEHNAPMVVIGVPRVGEPMRYQIVGRGGDSAGGVRRPAGRRAPSRSASRRRWSGLARRTPEQYFWLHRRWKHQNRGAEGEAGGVISRLARAASVQ